MSDYQDLENELCMLLCRIASSIGLDADSYDDDIAQIAIMINMAEGILERTAIQGDIPRTYEQEIEANIKDKRSLILLGVRADADIEFWKRKALGLD